MDRTVGAVDDVAGRVVVVTGASRGLGAGMATHLATRGVHLGLCARTQPAVTLGSGAAHVVTASVDVTDPDAVEAFSLSVTSRLGPIDLWINNAGLLDPIGPLRDADPAAVARNIEVNVIGVLVASAAYARHVRSRPGGGVLVNISSGAATSVYSGWGPYCASKAAVDHATRVLAVEEADAGLRALAVAPGVVDTDMQAAIRATPAERFPAVDRFHRMKADDAFNSPGWVADRILDLAFGDGVSSEVVHRVPDEPRP